MKQPTEEQFLNFQKLFEFYNVRLFENQLPSVILNFSRKNQAAGFFATNRWEKNLSGEKKHEISINPSSLNQGKEYVIQTLVHEMCHLWQEEFGTPSRKGYHNKEWSDKMISVGLIPSDTGEEGGKKVGQSMSDYLEQDGKLHCLIKEMPDEIWLPFKALESFSVTELELKLEEIRISGSPEEIEEIESLIQFEEEKQKKNKTKYTCDSCKTNVWGKPNLKIICGECDLEFYSSDLE